MNEPNRLRRSGVVAGLLTWCLAGGLVVGLVWISLGWIMGGRWGTAGVMALAFGLVGLALGTRRVAAAIHGFAADARRVVGGDPDVPPRRSAVSELDELGLAFAEFTRLLEERSHASVRGDETLRTVIESLPQGVLLIEPDGRIGYHNSAAVEALGSIPEHLSRLVPVALQRLVAAAVPSDERQADEVEHGLPSRILRAVAARLAAPSVGVVLVVTDVTERRRVEATRRDFVADASHELKTPLAAVVASTDALRLALARDPDRAEAFAAQVESSAYQLGRIVDDLLDLSRVESAEPRMEAVPVHRVVQDEVERISSRARELDLHVHATAESVSVEGSERDLALAVRNLLDNALRYTEAGGHIEVSVGSDGDHVEISVSDTGRGIPSRALPRIFERFYRVDVARSRATGGTGLGLAIVKHVVERHGGRVTVESTLGEGSTFRIRLPAAAVGRDAPAPVDS